jgi:hypothetical protein
MRTWDQNRAAINQLWPQCVWTDEERRLWHDDLHRLDQEVLYDAIKNVKRNNESMYPQLKWVRDEHRHLHRLKTFSEKKRLQQSEPRQVVRIDKSDDAAMREELKAVVEMTTPAEFQNTVDLIADKAASLKIEMSTAFRLVSYLLRRLGMDNGNAIGGAT